MFYGANPKTFAKAKELRMAMTDAEQLLWAELSSNKLGLRFKPQHPIDRFIADFYCHKLLLVIEVDGSIHDLQEEYDLERTNELNKLGISVIRFSNEEVKNNLSEVLKTIKNRIQLEIKSPSGDLGVRI